MNQNTTTATATATATPSEPAKMTARELLNWSIATNAAEAAAIGDELAKPVLDGTPWLLCINDGGNRIYGQWHNPATGTKVNGFASVHALDWHLCGAACYSEARAKELVEQMRRNGTYPARKMHRREFLLTRRGICLAGIASAQGMLNNAADPAFLALAAAQTTATAAAN